MARPGPTTQGYIEGLAGSVLLLARMDLGWSQRQLARAAGVPVSTVARIENGTRQPSFVTMSKLLAAAGLEMKIVVEQYDDHDDVLDKRRSQMSNEQRVREDERFTRIHEVLATSRREHAEQQARIQAMVDAATPAEAAPAGAMG